MTNEQRRLSLEIMAIGIAARLAKGRAIRPIANDILRRWRLQARRAL